jgi:hypothetical protein
MTSIDNETGASLAGFLAGWDKRLRESQQLPVSVAVLVLTNFGDRPVASTRLAEILGLSVTEAEARAQGHCATGAPVEDGPPGSRTGSSPSSTPSTHNQLPGGCSRSVTTGSA